MRKLRHSNTNSLVDKISVEHPGSDLLPCIPGEYKTTVSNQNGDHERLPGGGGAGEQTRCKLTRKSSCPPPTCRRKDKTGGMFPLKPSNPVIFFISKHGLSAFWFAHLLQRERERETDRQTEIDP